MSFVDADVVDSYGPDEPSRFIAAADYYLQREDVAMAAAALDRAYGLAPHDADLARHRAQILDQLAAAAHGLVFRYVPAGTFLMGSTDGDPDERPVHPVRVGAFWITEAPITWTRACALLGWQPPPAGLPPGEDDWRAVFGLRERNKLRHLYCETGRPAPGKTLYDRREIQEMLVADYDVKPMIAVGHDDAEDVARAIGCALPTEAQWEKAARGGLVGCRYAWGNDSPTVARCDFDHMGDFRIADPRTMPANGYGLYGMCGGVAEWTADGYDALAYTGERGEASGPSRSGPPSGARVLRGGSWSDCAAAVTVSFRASRVDEGWRTDFGGAANIGFRLLSGTDPRHHSRSSPS